MHFDSEKLPWYNTAIQGILTDYYKDVWNDLKDLENISAANQDVWAQEQSKNYMNLRHATGNNVAVTAISAAVLKHMLESGNILSAQPISFSQGKIHML